MRPEWAWMCAGLYVLYNLRLFASCRHELYLYLSRVGWARPKLEGQQKFTFMLTYELTCW